MNKPQPAILLEFNELCPKLLDRWIDGGELPNFKHLRDTSTVCVTEADELGAPNLEPWIQWYSLHTGMPFSSHGVFRLSEGAKLPHASIWDLLLDHGKSVINFSSMNCRGFQRPGSVFLPDPWCDIEHAYPESLENFRAFYRKVTQEQANGSWTVRELTRVVTFLLGHGLSAATVMAAVRQLFDEKLSKVPTQWRRVGILDRILLDVFSHYYRRYRPQFATFFSNSTAHLQHAYWRYLEPEKFNLELTGAQREAYGDAVKFGYRAMDSMLGQVLTMAERSGAAVMFATALSQQAYTAYEDRGGRHYYRPHDVKQILHALGVSGVEIQPVMAHQYIVTTADEASRRAAQARIERPSVGGKQLFDVADGDSPNRLIFGAQIYALLSDDQLIDGFSEGAAGAEPFFKHFYRLESTKSGGHHPDGCFWFQTGSHQRKPGKVSILDVAPTILHHFGVAPAHSMGGRAIQAA